MAKRAKPPGPKPYTRAEIKGYMFFCEKHLATESVACAHLVKACRQLLAEVQRLRKQDELTQLRCDEV